MTTLANNVAADAAERPTPLTRHAAALLVLCIFVGATEGYDVQAMALAAPLIKSAWRLDFQHIGLLIAASSVGQVLGSFLLSPIGDSWGRRPGILLGLLIAAVGTGAGALAPDFSWLAATRLLAGLGLGLALPNVIAMALELAPPRMHALAVVLVMSGYPLGGAIGAAAASPMIPSQGYAAVFIVGGAATALSLLLCLVALPESPSFLGRKPARAGELSTLLARLGRADPVEFEPQKVVQVEGTRARVAALFATERRRGTIFLWLMNLGNVALVYFFISWLPSLIVAGGLDAGAALRATSLFGAVGTAGALLMVLTFRKLGPIRVLAAAYAAALAATLALAFHAGSGGLFYLTIAVAGVSIVGSQFCLSAVVAQFYPAAIRATASGFATGVGRAGAILTPIVAGSIIGAMGGSSRAYLIAAALAAIALVAALGLELSGDMRRKAP
jgi:AAHS family 4-hydroxybenzoate transporter-like MFS transporter